MAATTKKNEKVRLVAEYLRAAPLDDAARAAVFFTGSAFPRNQERVLAAGGALVWQAVARLSGCAPEVMEATYRRHGDLGAMTEELFSGDDRERTLRVARGLPAGPAGRASSGTLTLAEVGAAFEELAARRGPSQKQAALEALLARASPPEARYIIKVMTGDLRIGLRESLVEEAIARAFEQPLKEVQRANMLTGDIGATLRLAAAGQLGEARPRLFHPMGFMLASPAETAAEAMEYFPDGAMIEDKFDGIRAQAHKGEGRVRIFSRTLDEVVEFPELAAPLAALAGGFILDGEIVAWRDGRPLPFTELQKRLGRRHPDLFLSAEIPVAFLAFDLMYDGDVLLDLALAERRRRLESLLMPAKSPMLRLSAASSCGSADELQAAFDGAFARGNEGVMAKAPGSPYTPGRRGRAWLKLKRPMATLDVVVTAVEFGHGRRAGLLSDYTFSVRDGDSLRTIGKAYSGLTDAEILRLTGFFNEHTIEDQGFRRSVEPLVVLEVAFNNIQRSARHQSGYALRFPRIVRLRPDKPVSEIDTLESVRQLYELQFVSPKS